MNEHLSRDAAAGGLLTRAVADGVGAQTEERRIDVRLVAWGDIAENTHEGIRETFARGAFAGNDPTRVVLEAQRHDGPLVGVAEAIEEREDGAYARFRVASTAAGDELLALAREGVLRDASVVFRPIRSRKAPGGVIERQAVELARVAILPRGAYPSASVLSVRSEEEPVNDTATVDLSPVTAAIEELATRMGAIETLASTPPVPAEAPLLYRCDGLGDYMFRALEDPELRGLLARDWTDQTVTGNESLVRPTWLTQVYGIIDRGRPSVSAFGTRPLPETGMKVEWPTFTGSLAGLVAEQVTQKTEIASASVVFGSDDAAIKTYAGGSDLAYQLIHRSSPSYREAYGRVMAAAWSRVTNAAFVARLVAESTVGVSYRNGLGPNITLSTSAAADDIVDAATHGLAIGDAVVFTALTGGAGLVAGRVYWVTGTSFAAGTFRPSATPGGAPVDFTTDISAGTVAKVIDATGVTLRQRLFEASLAVEDATGEPASIVLASTDLFLATAAMTGIVPPVPVGNPSNASGTALASTLRVNISGLDVTHDADLPAGTMFVSTPQAAGWYEDGPHTITAEDVRKLGQDVAIYSLAAGAVLLPAGVVKVTTL